MMVHMRCRPSVKGIALRGQLGKEHGESLCRRQIPAVCCSASVLSFDVLTREQGAQRIWPPKPIRPDIHPTDTMKLATEEQADQEIGMV